MKRTSVSINEVARLAGVSKSTVSRVVSEKGGSVSPKALEAVNAAIQELGYAKNSLAAGLRSRRTYMVLVMVPDIANPFWSETARAIQDRLEEESYSVVVGSTDWKEDREARYYRLAKSHRFDGVILNSVTDDMEAIRKLGVPAVLLGQRSENSSFDTVGTDTWGATKIALEYLYETGHRRIAIATSENGSERFLSLRRRAYSDFLAERNLSQDSGIEFSVKLSEAGGVDLVRSILAIPQWRERLDSLFCGNDLLALSAIKEFRAAGIEPGKDISVIGMDDIPAAALTPPGLTTVRKPREKTGALAAELLLRRMAEPDRAAVKMLFPGELILRGSVRGKRM